MPIARSISSVTRHRYFAFPVSKDPHRMPSQQEKKHLLVTGATGLVGQFLLKDLSLRNEPLAVVVRHGRKANAEQRIESIMARWESKLGKSLPRPVVIAGDVSKPGLDVADKDIEWLSNHCDRVLHNAAILQFVGEHRAYEPWVTNFEGSKHRCSLGPTNRSDGPALCFDRLRQWRTRWSYHGRGTGLWPGISQRL